MFLISSALLSLSISFDSYAYPGDDYWLSGWFDRPRPLTPAQQAAISQHEEAYQEATQEAIQEVSKRNNDLADAETACNVNVYSVALQKYITSPRGSHPVFTTMPKVPDLDRIMHKCYKTGSLNALVQTNIDAGGDPTKPYHRQATAIGDHYIANDGSGPIDGQRYNGAALNHLCMQKMQNLSSEQTADISNTVDTLVKSGCKADKGLLYAAQYGNMIMAQMLMSRGANIYKPVKVGSSPEHATAISFAQGIMSKVKLMTLQANLSFRKRHANLED